MDKTGAMSMMDSYFPSDLVMVHWIPFIILGWGYC